MYVMCGLSEYRIQVFSQDGQLIRGVIPRNDIKGSFFFTLDRTCNIIVADYWGHQIKVFSYSGHQIHTVSNDKPTKDQKLSRPNGISVGNRTILW